MEPIILIFIKLMGAAISGHWDLAARHGLHETMTLLRGFSGGSVRTSEAVAQKRHILASQSCLAAKMAVPSDS